MSDLNATKTKNTFYESFVKRAIDFFLALAGLIVLSPVFLIIAVAIKIESKGPVIFKQKRIGKNGKVFEIYKFRSMCVDTPNDMPTHLLKNADVYITKIGKILRKTSLDELPQILNILKGDMAVIGPRPALWNQYDLLEERNKYGANNVRPGLTGLAQISGRDELSIEKKAELDGVYVENITLFFDIKLFVKTIFSVLKSDGIVEGENELDSEENLILK